ncbi:MAG TPA: hypothetical protein VEI73_11460 [Candidatus Acidoferrum sp.]|nr:hypothetical protein [Candidatus Acidoferrum sp.]
MTTYVMGAGASAHAGFPLASHLGNELWAWTSSSCGRAGSYDYWTSIDVLHDLYGDLENIERILTDFDDATIGSPAGRLHPSDRKHHLSGFLVALREFLAARGAGHAALYERFVSERVKEGDTFLTFNYDAELERALKSGGLWEIGDGYGFPNDLPGIPKSKVHVLKLHGSMNWYGLIMGGHQGAFSPSTMFGSQPVCTRPCDLKYLGYPPELKDPGLAAVTQFHAAPAMILPICSKRFYWKTFFSNVEWEQFWDDLWKLGEGVLRSSENIIIIGYGMAQVDQRARNLLLNGSNQEAEITLYCGSRTETIRDEFKARGFKHVEAPPGQKFENFLGTAP